MDGRGGCCIARYGGGGGGAGAYDMSTVDRIMLRFRPIAPKPANTVSTSPEISEAGSRSSRGKRRFHNRNDNKKCNNNNSSSNRKRKALTEKKVDSKAVTLPLLPETPDLLSPKPAKSVPTWLSFGSNDNNHTHHHHDLMMISGLSSIGMSVDPKTVADHQIMRVVIDSCVTVECVTDTWVDEQGLGYTDEEKCMNLEKDTCPGFLSDGYGRVKWTNEAYKRMVSQGDGGEVVVWLVMKETETVVNKRAFTCRVRVQNQSTCKKGKEKRSTTVPCDVWRMESGGFAWRLDVKAALSLGW